jgi:hypothetical protein
MRPVCGCKHKYGGLIYQLQLLLGAHREKGEREREGREGERERDLGRVPGVRWDEDFQFPTSY